jgi:deoxyribonuclease (pyrimidine dimer)
MTRINAYIEPFELTDQHLLAEIRELPRVFNTIKSGKAVIKNIPENFSLNQGHVKFFYDKLKYLVQRHKDLVSEAEKRCFNVLNYSNSYTELPNELFNDWNPNLIVREILKERINERLQGMKNLRYNRQPVEFTNIKIK